MKMLRLIAGVMIATACVMVSATAVSAAPKAGCAAAGNVSKVSVEDAAATIWADLLDNSPWEDEADFRETSVRPEDSNGDGYVCLRILWGEDLNPNSYWYRLGVELIGSPTQTFIYLDNNAAAAGRAPGA